MESLPKESLDQIFLKARTYDGWLDKPVADQTLRQIYEVMKFGPTSANGSPARLVFVKSPEAKSKLIPCMAEGNQQKTKKAPVTVIIAEDIEFYEKLPRLMPHVDAKAWFAGNPSLIKTTALRNSSLQGAYFMIAARALGLDCGPMSGFDNEKVDEAFLKGTTWRSNFVCNLGHGDSSKLHPRLPRLDYEEVCKIV